MIEIKIEGGKVFFVSFFGQCPLSSSFFIRTVENSDNIIYRGRFVKNDINISTQSISKKNFGPATNVPTHFCYLPVNLGICVNFGHEQHFLQIKMPTANIFTSYKTGL